jgi:hypothetical protein
VGLCRSTAFCAEDLPRPTESPLPTQQRTPTWGTSCAGRCWSAGVERRDPFTAMQRRALSHSLLSECRQPGCALVWLSGGAPEAVPAIANRPLAWRIGGQSHWITSCPRAGRAVPVPVPFLPPPPRVLPRGNSPAVSPLGSGIATSTRKPRGRGLLLSESNLPHSPQRRPQADTSVDELRPRW